MSTLRAYVYSGGTTPRVQRLHDADVLDVAAGIDSTVSTLSIGGASATGIDIARNGITSTVHGPLQLISHTAFSASAKIENTAGVQTTNATTTTLFTIALADATSSWVEAKIIARDSANASNGNHAAFLVWAMVARDNAGSPVLGDVHQIVADCTQGAAAWSVTMTISSNNLLVQVTGVASVTINWGGFVSQQAVSLNT